MPACSNPCRISANRSRTGASSSSRVSSVAASRDACERRIVGVVGGERVCERLADWRRLRIGSVRWPSGECRSRITSAMSSRPHCGHNAVMNNELDPRFSDPVASAVPWEDAQRVLEDAQLAWITTVRTDGRPHVTPLVTVWLDDALHFCTGPDEQKARNLAANPNVVVTTGCNQWDEGLDVVVEGEAQRVTDAPTLERLAARGPRSGTGAGPTSRSRTASPTAVMTWRRRPRPGARVRGPRHEDAGLREGTLQPDRDTRDDHVSEERTDAQVPRTVHLHG